MSSEEIYGSVEYYWEIENEASQQFSSSFREEYDEFPQVFSAHVYANVRSTLRAIDRAGTTEADPVRKELEGMEIFPQLWGVGEQYRACDHRGTLPPVTVRGRPEGDLNADSSNPFEVIEIVEDVESTMIPCEETGCNMPE